MGNEPSKKVFGMDLTRAAVLIFLSLIISFFLYPGILKKPNVYKIGDIAEADIKAPEDILVRNDETTEKERDKAVQGVPYVYDFDPSASNLSMRLREAMAETRKLVIFQAVDPFDPTSTDEIQLDTTDAKKTTAENFFRSFDLPLDNELFERIVACGCPNNLETSIIRLVTDIFKKGVVGNLSVLMNQIPKGIILQSMLNQEEELINDISRFYDINGAVKRIEERKGELVEAGVPEEIADIAVRISTSLIKPNVTFNKRETEERRDRARQAVKDFYYQVKRGEMIIREGERVEPDDLLKLTAVNKTLEDRNILWRIPGMSILMGTLFTVIYITGFMKFKPLGRDHKHLLFSSATLLGVFIFTWAFNFIAEEVARGFHHLTPRALLFALPVTFGAILITIFQGMNMAVIFSFLVSIFASLIFNGNVELLIYFFAGSIFASYLVREYRERGILIKVGLKIGLLNILICLAIESIYGALFTTESLVSVVSGFLGGILAGVISTGLIPLVEMSFGFTTDIKLLELANLDQPLLRDLMVQAPGTYHHSVIVSNMVEATAKAINANPLLAKVAAYYHDIGKMKKPLYFIENQMGGENKHEKLAPSMSSLVLISHVKDGVELARQHKLGQEIIDIIQQHQGKGLITYFYQKAKDQAMCSSKGIDIKEDDFRYPGPKPQTKEAGLVMLADMIEAASRSLPDPTPARINGIVQKIINKVFSDGQLDECELTLKDLHEIAKSFNKTLSGIFHQRVEYPDPVTTKKAKKATNGDSDKGGQENTRAKKSDDTSEDGEGLKRLGL
ncbi:MAG: HDIG domain-containing protein [Deltaproteobacteria bacterium]|nr:HDIG domain-containing protein [Deltaproteobacteria bacterium]